MPKGSRLLRRPAEHSHSLRRSAVTVLTLGEAEAFAARTLAAIERMYGAAYSRKERGDADRERVASDLAGLRECYVSTPPYGQSVLRTGELVHARRYSDNLRRTAALYGVTS